MPPQTLLPPQPIPPPTPPAFVPPPIFPPPFQREQPTPADVIMTEARPEQAVRSAYVVQEGPPPLATPSPKRASGMTDVKYYSRKRSGAK